MSENFQNQQLLSVWEEARFQAVIAKVIDTLPESENRRTLIVNIQSIFKTVKVDIVKGDISLDAVYSVVDHLSLAVDAAARANPVQARQHLNLAISACTYKRSLRTKWTLIGMTIGAFAEAAILTVICVASHGLVIPALFFALNCVTAAGAGGYLGDQYARRRLGARSSRTCMGELFHSAKRQWKQNRLRSKISSCGIFASMSTQSAATSRQESQRDSQEIELDNLSLA